MTITDCMFIFIGFVFIVGQLYLYYLRNKLDVDITWKVNHRYELESYEVKAYLFYKRKIIKSKLSYLERNGAPIKTWEEAKRIAEQYRDEFNCIRKSIRNGEILNVYQ